MRVQIIMHAHCNLARHTGGSIDNSTGVGTRGAGCAIAPPIFLRYSKTLVIVVSSGL